MIFQESEKVELKAIVVDDIKKEIVAFANCMGGTIYIGVQDDGKVIGIEDVDKSSLQVSNMVRDSIKPDLTMFVHYETLTIDGKDIIKIEISKGSNSPYYLANKGLRPEGVYVRQGYSSVSASNIAIRNMIEETDGDHFEDMRSLEQNLTFNETKKEFEMRNIKFGMAQMKTLGILTQDGAYTNLGLLLSDQCLHTIKVATFEGTNQNQFKDRKEFTGSIFKQLEDVYEYIDFRNQIHSSFDKLRRIDRKDYKEVALRETLLNLIVHREYSYRASSFISIYKDRIEFTSIGGLVSDITLKDITMGISICRNVKLANIFYRLELIEAYGIGIKKIMNAYDGYIKKPVIEVSDNVFKVTLPNLNIESEEKKQDGINSKEEKVRALVSKKGFITRKEVEELLNISQSSCGRLLKQMIENKEIMKCGNGKNIYYSLTH